MGGRDVDSMKATAGGPIPPSEDAMICTLRLVKDFEKVPHSNSSSVLFIYILLLLNFECHSDKSTAISCQTTPLATMRLV